MTQDNSVTRVPEEVKMTDAHIEMLRRLTTIPYHDKDGARLRNVESLVRSIVENRVVPVPHDLISRWAQTVHAEAGNDDNGVLMDLAGEISGWLSRNTPAPEVPQ